MEGEVEDIHERERTLQKWVPPGTAIIGRSHRLAAVGIGAGAGLSRRTPEVACGREAEHFAGTGRRARARSAGRAGGQAGQVQGLPRRSSGSGRRRRRHRKPVPDIRKSTRPPVRLVPAGTAAVQASISR